MSRWINQWFEMAAGEPERLLAVVDALPVEELTYAAEALGAIADDRANVKLRSLLKHDSALVREGAVYGATRHRSCHVIRQALERMSTGDESPGVRAAAAEALEDS